MMSRFLMGILVVMGVCFASPAEAALCSSDLWGSRSSNILVTGSLKVQIQATTSLHHGATHGGCSGAFSAKSVLQGSGASCTTGTDSKTHQADGTNLVTYTSTYCAGLSYWVVYRAQGIHNGFGEAQVVSTSSNSAYFFPNDVDGDGYSVQAGDCNDNRADVNPGVILTCNSIGPGDKNCNGQDDIQEMVSQCPNCPLILSLGGSGIQLTPPEAGVWFDLNADGDPEKLSWTIAGAGGAWLALDRNSNGRIDNGLELFSNFAAQTPSEEPNGFAALQMFDANRDGWIDTSDPVFSLLLAWSDDNHDGVSQGRELQSLSQLGVKKVSLDFRESRRRDRYGNAFKFWAALISERQSDVGRFVVDVFLRALVGTAR